MSIEIEQSLNKNVLDFLILQTIAECKLNRSLTDTSNQSGFSRFYNNYIANNSSFYNNDGSENTNLINQFKVALGAIPNLSEAAKLSSGLPEYEDYIPDIKIPSEGGAGLYTKLPEQQVDYFIQNYQIISYHGNDNAGFSATVFKDLRTGIKTISFRSTEFGEDYIKDAMGADTEIKNYGTAFAQTTAMINYIEQLKNNNIIDIGDTINVSGYSLGSHLAANFNKMYSDEFNINQMYNFNGPGAGILTPNIDDESTIYNNFKNELKSYNNLISIFGILRMTFESNNINIIDCKEAVDALTEFSQQDKDYAIDYLDYLFVEGSMSNMDLLTSVIDSNLNLAQISNLPESEGSKDQSININKDPSYLYSTIYGSNFYQTYTDFLINKYVPEKASSTFGVITTNGGNTGIEVSSSFYEGNPTWIGGWTTNAYGNQFDSDYKIVTNSNYFTNPLDLIIEDRPEWEGNGPRLPLQFNISEATKNNTGDFGNTHSITLLNKTLSLMTFLADIEGKSFIDVKKYTALISSATAEKSSPVVPSTQTTSSNYKELNYGENNSIAFIMNVLTKAILPNAEKFKDVVFNNTLEGWADINKIQELEKRQDLIKQYLTSFVGSITIESLYDINSDDLRKDDSTPLVFKTASELFDKVMLNNDEGKAYRYAIENLNTFVIKGLNYDNMDFESKEIDNHTEEWYKSRIEVLLGVIESNILNSGDLLANNKILVDDKNQGLAFHTIQEKYDPKIYGNFSELESKYRPAGTNHVVDNTPQTANYSSYYESRSYKLHFNGNYEQTMDDIYRELGIFVPLDNSSPIILPVDQQIADKMDFKNNIYYLNPFSTTFINNQKESEDEKVFVHADTEKIYQYINSTPDIPNTLTPEELKRLAVYTHDYKIENGIKTINFNIQLTGGDDYLEILNPDEIATISSTKGKKHYFLNIKEATITDPDKTGTITFDGILLTGATKLNGEKFQQTETVNGVVHNFNYDIDYETKSLVITHENTGHKISISNMTEYGNGTSFGFTSLPTLLINPTQSIQVTDFAKSNINPDPLQLEPLAERYGTVAQFTNATTISSGITNAVGFISGTSLVLYDRTNPNNKSIISEVFNTDGTLRAYNSQVIVGYRKLEDDTYVPIYVPIYGPISGPINIAEISIINALLTNSNFLTGGMSFGNIEASIDFRPTDRYEIDFSIFSNNHLVKDGNDLVLTKNNYLNSEKITIKNYFTFNHALHTNIYTNNIELTVEQFMNNLDIKLSDGNDLYLMNELTYNTVNGGFGDDVIAGSSKDEIFKSTGIVSSEPSVNGSPKANHNDGNDTFTGGLGNDKFVFSGSFGNDTINDFSINDSIYIAGSIDKKRDNNDLILISDLGMLRIKNYFMAIDFKSDTRIFNMENTLAIPFDLSFLENFTVYQMEKKDYVQEAYNPTTSPNDYKTIIGNTLDNNITVTRNNTVIKGSNYLSTNDGNDKYFFSIPQTSMIPTETNNTYRTELDFNLYHGNDEVINATFNASGDYGDIINIGGIEIAGVTFRKNMEEEELKSLTMYLQDGSSLLINLNEDIALDAEIIKNNTQTYTLENILDSIITPVYEGTNANNILDYSGFYMNDMEITGLAGNDTIKSNRGNDSISGGTGFDNIYLSSGKDEYVFRKGSDIDTFHFKEIREKLDITFVLDPLYNASDVKYSYDGVNKKIYLSFSENDGVIFTDAEWPDLLILHQGLKIEFANGTAITPPDLIETVTEMPFTPIAKILSGSSSANTLTVDNTYNHAVFGNGGNDTIISQGSDHNKSLIFGGTGNDNITANQGDIINVRSGDGTDTITSTGNNYLINLLRSNSIVNNGEEKLFDISVANTNDLSIRYGGTNDKLILKNYFNPNNTVEKDITVALFENNHNTTKIYSLQEILDDLDITRASLQSSGTRTINQSDIDFDEESDAGKIIGGEIAYNYLSNGNAYSDQSEASILLNGMSNGKMLMNKN